MRVAARVAALERDAARDAGWWWLASLVGADRARELRRLSPPGADLPSVALLDPVAVDVIKVEDHDGRLVCWVVDRLVVEGEVELLDRLVLGTAPGEAVRFLMEARLDPAGDGWARVKVEARRDPAGGVWRW